MSYITNSNRRSPKTIGNNLITVKHSGLTNNPSGPRFMIENASGYLSQIQHSNQHSFNSTIEEFPIVRTKSAPPFASSRRNSYENSSINNPTRGYSTKSAVNRGYGHHGHRGTPSATPLNVNVPRRLVALYQGLARSSTRPVTASDNFQTRHDAKLLLRHSRPAASYQLQRVNNHDNDKLPKTLPSSPRSRVYNFIDHIVSKDDVTAPPIGLYRSHPDSEAIDDDLDSASLISLRSDDSIFIDSSEESVFLPEESHVSLNNDVPLPTLPTASEQTQVSGVIYKNSKVGNRRGSSASIATSPRRRIGLMRSVSAGHRPLNQTDLISVVALSQSAPPINEDMAGNMKRISITLPRSGEDDIPDEPTCLESHPNSPKSDERSLGERHNGVTRQVYNCTMCVMCQSERDLVREAGGPWTATAMRSTEMKKTVKSISSTEQKLNKSLSPRLIEAPKQRRRTVPFALTSSATSFANQDVSYEKKMTSSSMRKLVTTTTSMNDTVAGGDVMNRSTGDSGEVNVNNPNNSSKPTLSNESGSSKLNFLDLKGTRVNPKPMFDTSPNIVMTTDQHGLDLVKEFHPELAQHATKDLHVTGKPTNHKNALTNSEQSPQSSQLDVPPLRDTSRMSDKVSLTMSNKKRHRDSLLQMQNSYANRAELHPKPVSRLEAQRFLDKHRNSHTTTTSVSPPVIVIPRMTTDDDTSYYSHDQGHSSRGSRCLSHPPPNSPELEFVEQYDHDSHDSTND